MSPASRHRYLLLALMFIASHMALAAHAAAHKDPGSIPCQLCVCQAQQSQALPSTTFYAAVIITGTPRVISLAGDVYTGVMTRDYDGRAPPISA